MGPSAAGSSARVSFAAEDVAAELRVLLFNRTCPDDACPVYFGWYNYFGVQRVPGRLRTVLPTSKNVFR